MVIIPHELRATHRPPCCPFISSFFSLFVSSSFLYSSLRTLFSNGTSQPFPFQSLPHSSFAPLLNRGEQFLWNQTVSHSSRHNGGIPPSFDFPRLPFLQSPLF